MIGISEFVAVMDALGAQGPVVRGEVRYGATGLLVKEGAGFYGYTDLALYGKSAKVAVELKTSWSWPNDAIWYKKDRCAEALGSLVGQVR
eukprot:587476-Amphidinium_carterae.2